MVGAGEVNVKRCSHCKQEKELSEFRRDKGQKDGYAHKCRACANFFENRNARCNRKRENLKHKLWMKLHPEAKRKKERSWYTRHKEWARNKWNRWRNANPETDNARSHRRRARARNASGRHTGEDIKMVFARDGNKCLRCGATERLTIDHVVPLAVGGSDAVDNLQTLCKSCNAWKGTCILDFRLG